LLLWRPEAQWLFSVFFKFPATMSPTFERNKVSSSYIPEDIAFSILSKLSIKSLNRFSSACKSWSLLFQNPNFLKMFRKNLVSKSHDDDDDTCLLFNWISGPVMLSFLSGDKFEKEVKLVLLLMERFVSMILVIIKGCYCGTQLLTKFM
jgi:hypothetical protein